MRLFVDFRKAFDLVDHGLLLEKLSYYKCSETFITLMKSYLANRTQVVSVNGKLSNATEINCGLPQGSILGPLLFLGFMKDLPLMLYLLTESTSNQAILLLKTHFCTTVLRWRKASVVLGYPGNTP